jgi:hypothetical protein
VCQCHEEPLWETIIMIHVCVHVSCSSEDQTLYGNIVVSMHGMISRMCVPRIGLYVSMCIHLTRTYVCMCP